MIKDIWKDGIKFMREENVDYLLAGQYTVFLVLFTLFYIVLYIPLVLPLILIETLLEKIKNNKVEDLQYLAHKIRNGNI